MMFLQNLSGWMGRTGPGFASPDEVQSFPKGPRGPRGRQVGAPWDPGRKWEQPGFSCGQMAAQLHDLRMLEAAKKEFKEYVRQQVSPQARTGARCPAGGAHSGRGLRVSWSGLLLSPPGIGCGHQAHILCAPGPA